ncbi:hypothetical protein JCM17478_21680 [Thermopirellula anaerolimosa]
MTVLFNGIDGGFVTGFVRAITVSSPQFVAAAIWREAGRHLEIQETTEAIMRVVGEHLPAAYFLVRRLQLPESQFETVAAAPLSPPWLGHRVTPLPPPLLAQAIDFAVRGSVAEFRPDQPADFDREMHWMLGNPPCQILLGGLRSERRPLGVLAVAGIPGTEFTPQHRDFFRTLLEPFATCLENDQRIREISLLREAAEADKQRLLTKLGRHALGDTIVGAEGGLRHVMERVDLVAASDAPVLLLGETGTGKELIARAIHNRSRRARGPCLRVNCGAIPPELIDSQLFGHERGSFTGASETHRGWFERANHGTLFLDEIGELSLPAQIRLLQVVQDGTFERVGGRQSIVVDVRIVAATHRDLREMVRQGLFREDLWYRLAVFPISLPPLRERLEDIPALARHFAERAAVRLGLALQLPNEEDIRLLMSYHWPGNVRELAAVIDRAAILGNGKRLEVAKALGVVDPTTAPESMYRPADGCTSHSETFPSLDDAVRAHIVEALRRTGGRIEGPRGAAALLQVNPHTLRSRMRKLGIPWKKFRDLPHGPPAQGS